MHGFNRVGLVETEGEVLPRYFFSRWVALSAACLIASSAGSGYAFGLYSKAFKENLLLTQTEVDSVATSGNFGLFSAVVAGVYYNYVGPTRCLFVGACLVGAGFQLMYLSLTGVISGHVGWLCLFNFLAQHVSPAFLFFSSVQHRQRSI